VKALLKKELTEVLVPFGAAFAVIVFGWLATAQFWEVLLPPASETLQIVALSSALAGAVLGYVQFSGERWRGKLGYLCHRGTGIDGAFLAKSIAGLLGTALVGLGPPVIYAVSQSLSSPNASILQWPILLVYASAATCGASVYGLGALAASLRRRPLVGILLIPLAGGALWLISEMCGTPWGLETSPWRFPAMHLALAGVCVLVGMFYIVLDLVVRDDRALRWVGLCFLVFAMIDVVMAGSSRGARGELGDPQAWLWVGVAPATLSSAVIMVTSWAVMDGVFSLSFRIGIYTFLS